MEDGAVNCEILKTIWPSQHLKIKFDEFISAGLSENLKHFLYFIC